MLVKKSLLWLKNIITNSDIPSSIKIIIFLYLDVIIYDFKKALVHNNYLFIPMNKVMGRVEKFVELYGQFMSPEMHDMYDRIKEYTESYNEDIAKNLNLLDRKYIYIDMTGKYDIPSLQSIVDNMNAKIKQLRDIPMMETEVKEPTIRAMTRG